VAQGPATASPGASREPARSSHCPTLADWLTGRYAKWQETTQTESTRRKVDSHKRYLIASDLGPMRLDAIATADVNRYVEWRQKTGPLTFAIRNDGEPYRARVTACASQTINKTVRILSAALRLANDEEIIPKVPKLNFLPEDDARPIMPPTDEQYRALIEAARTFVPVAAHLPEVVELLGEFGLRPAELLHLTWHSVDWDLGMGNNQGGIRIEEQKRTRVVGGQRWIPKNKKYRVVPFTARGREILLALQARFPDARPDDHVIPNENGLPYIRLDLGPMKGGGTGIWQRLREAAGVEGVAMRDMRHYFAVQNLLRGVPMSVVSSWMGHSSIELTVKRYGRWAAEAREQWRWAALRSSSVEQVIAGGRGPTA
jgi:integrase